MRNVEIKAKITDANVLIAKAKELSGTEGVIIEQHDTFFKTSKGRFKLRRFEAGSGELIYYERPDSAGPKLCNYKKVAVNAECCEDLNEILSLSNGVFGTVKKTRYLFIVGQTRVHIDEVKGLGSFMELEVVLRDDQTPEVGEKIAKDLMNSLGVQENDLISGAYMDILREKNQDLISH